MTLPDEILRKIESDPGLTDRELTNALRGASSLQQPVNQACRALETQGRLTRRHRADGRIGNYPPTMTEDQRLDAVVADEVATGVEQTRDAAADPLAEDVLKGVLKDWLESAGWDVAIAWGKSPGVDIVAERGEERWLIEVKGRGSSQPMRHNYFLGILGETLQRMHDAETRYSIALPDLPQFRGLWSRLPEVAKARTQISAIFVSEDGAVDLA